MKGWVILPLGWLVLILLLGLVGYYTATWLRNRHS